jgi:hypothetical protein
MGTTPVFGFPYPDPSDLVANYPALGQQLAEDVEDEIIASGGLSHINTTAFSAVSAVNLNNVFSATYENYLMLMKFTGSAISGLSVRMRLSGTDNTANSYVRQRLLAYNTGVSGARTTDTSATLCNSGTALNSFRAEIFNPFATEPTGFISLAKSSEDVASMTNSTATHDVSTSYDGISLITLVGTMTGTVRIYGYKNS